MILVHFLSDYDYTPSSNKHLTIAYRAGWTVQVEDECADGAVARGAAEHVQPAAGHLAAAPASQHEAAPPEPVQASVAVEVPQTELAAVAHSNDPERDGE